MLASTAAALVVELNTVVLGQSSERHLAGVALLLTHSVLMQLESKYKDSSLLMTNEHFKSCFCHFIGAESTVSSG